MSNGAQMSTLLACRIPDRIAGVAPIAGVEFNEPCSGPPVPVIAFHGVADPIVPYAGGGLSSVRIADQNFFKGSVPAGTADPTGVDASMQAWAAHNGCRQDPVETRVSPEVRKRTWQGARRRPRSTSWTTAGTPGRVSPSRPSSSRSGTAPPTSTPPASSGPSGSTTRPEVPRRARAGDPPSWRRRAYRGPGSGRGTRASRSGQQATGDPLCVSRSGAHPKAEREPDGDLRQSRRALTVGRWELPVRVLLPAVSVDTNESTGDLGRVTVRWVNRRRPWLVKGPTVGRSRQVVADQSR